MPWKVPCGIVTDALVEGFEKRPCPRRASTSNSARHRSCRSAMPTSVITDVGTGLGERCGQTWIRYPCPLLIVTATSTGILKSLIIVLHNFLTRKLQYKSELHTEDEFITNVNSKGYGGVLAFWRKKLARIKVKKLTRKKS
jgi:hypothetical protein